MITRIPHLEDAPELAALIDAQESALDPGHKPAPESWPRDLLKGHFPNPQNQVWCDDAGVILAWASCQPDPHRRRVEVEVFRRPGFPDLAAVWQWCVERGSSDFPDFVLWPTINSYDEEFAALLTTSGFELLRRYHMLTRPLQGETPPLLPAECTIEVMRSPADHLAWHTAHQDAFSRHFGFTPRPYDDWIALMRDSESADPDGRFLLRVDGQVAGFVVCGLDNAHDNGGYIALLGVTHQYQGRGYGELLLRWAFSYSAGKGFTEVDLVVDTGNVSGALALYHKLGFTPLSEFHLYAKNPSPSF